MKRTSDKILSQLTHQELIMLLLSKQATIEDLKEQVQRQTHQIKELQAQTISENL